MMIRSLLCVYAAIVCVVSGCDDMSSLRDAGHHEEDGGHGDAATPMSLASWQTRCISGESDPSCSDYPARELTPEPPNRENCAIVGDGDNRLVSALLETAANPSEGGMRFEFRDAAVDGAGRFVGGEGCVLYVSEPFCTFGGSCGGTDPDCFVIARLAAGRFAGTVSCPRLRCGDLYGIASAEDPALPARFDFGTCE